MKDQIFRPLEADLRMADIYRDFLPETIFDAHMHLYRGCDIPNFHTTNEVFLRERATVEDYLAHMAPMLPGVRSVHLNAIPMPDWAMAEPGSVLRDHANGYLAQLHRQHPECTLSPFVLGCDTEETVEAIADLPGVRGLKCYSYGVPFTDFSRLHIREYLPEAAWKAADRRRLPIVLHMVRPAYLSDPENFSYILTMAKKYPDARLILAHCAAAFMPWTAMEPIRRLEDTGNIWFDISYISETAPILACILKYGGKRTMWGSDYPCCFHRGRLMGLGTGFTQLSTDEFAHLDRAHMVSENLLSFYHAALAADLDQTQVNDLFYGNAARLFGHE